MTKPIRYITTAAAAMASTLCPATLMSASRSPALWRPVGAIENRFAWKVHAAARSNDSARPDVR